MTRRGMAATILLELRKKKHMHPDHPGYIDELYAYFRSILVKHLSPEQLQLHDYYSTNDTLYEGEDCFDEFPLVDGLPELLIEDTDDDLEDEEEDFDDDEEAYLYDEEDDGSF